MMFNEAVPEEIATIVLIDTKKVGRYGLDRELSPISNVKMVGTFVSSGLVWKFYRSIY